MNNRDFWEAIKYLKPNLFKTYSAIYKLSDNELGYCFASNRVLEEKIGKTNIYRDITELKNLGYIRTIEVKDKTNILERRMYTNQNLKTYLEDFENKKNLLKSFYEIEEGVMTYYNERNLHKIKHSKAILKTEERGTLKTEEEATLKTEGVTISNNNLSNTKQKNREIKFFDSDLKKDFIIKPQILLVMFKDYINNFDKNFILELALNYQLNQVRDAYSKAVVNKAINKASYMRSILKFIPKSKIKKIEEEIIEKETKKTPKKSRGALIRDFLVANDVMYVKNLQKPIIKILDRTIINSNYKKLGEDDYDRKFVEYIEKA